MQIFYIFKFVLTTKRRRFRSGKGIKLNFSNVYISHTIVSRSFGALLENIRNDTGGICTLPVVSPMTTRSMENISRIVSPSIDVSRFLTIQKMLYVLLDPWPYCDSLLLRFRRNDATCVCSIRYNRPRFFSIWNDRGGERYRSYSLNLRHFNCIGLLGKFVTINNSYIVDIFYCIYRGIGGWSFAVNRIRSHQFIFYVFV